MSLSRVFASAAFASALTLFAAPATYAQSADAGAEATATEAKAAADTTAAAEPGKAGRTEISYESLLAALGDVGTRVKDYNAAEDKDPEDVQVVDVAPLMPADAAEYAEARARYVNFVTYLQRVTGKVSLLSDALQAASVENTDVVALDVLDDGRIILFYDARDEATLNSTEAEGEGAEETENAATEQNEQ